MKKAHRRADRIIEYAADVSLIASFHYKKKNFHLVKLLEVRTRSNIFVRDDDKIEIGGKRKVDGKCMHL